MTGLPAMRMGLKDRGVIKEGYKADLVVFDPATIIDKATFTEPHQYPEGISHVFVNGKITVNKGKYEDVRAGVVLRRE